MGRAGWRSRAWALPCSPSVGTCSAATAAPEIAWGIMKRRIELLGMARPPRRTPFTIDEIECELRRIVGEIARHTSPVRSTDACRHAMQEDRSASSRPWRPVQRNRRPNRSD
jgi:hypothetical protein